MPCIFCNEYFIVFHFTQQNTYMYSLKALYTMLKGLLLLGFLQYKYDTVPKIIHVLQFYHMISNDMLRVILQFICKAIYSVNSGCVASVLLHVLQGCHITRRTSVTNTIRYVILCNVYLYSVKPFNIPFYVLFPCMFLEVGLVYYLQI